jgi:predicted RNA binding protein YcfA (HicA-like mRNA interferase family)
MRTRFLPSPINWAALRSFTAREIVNALLRDGFSLRSQSTGHQRYQHPDGRRVTVSFHHQGQTFPPKILRSMIEEQARWSEEDLRRLKLIK